MKRMKRITVGDYLTFVSMRKGFRYTSLITRCSKSLCITAFNVDNIACL